MSIIVLGLNHQSAPVALRERLSLHGCALDRALDDLNASREPVHLAADSDQHADIHESAILATCNRLEIYAVTNDPGRGFARLLDFLIDLHGIERKLLLPHLYRLADRTAARHLMRVACGLDSMILGEPQILGQVTEAYARARSAGTAGPVLSQVFVRAVRAGKRARSETAISRHTTSVGHAAAHLARDVCGDLSAARVLLVGAGEMAELAAIALINAGAHDFTCISRTHASAAQLACRVSGRALAWNRLHEALVEADIILTATAAPHTVIHYDTVAQALPQRKGRQLVVLDVALPRDVEARIRGLAGVLLYDLDDLQGTVDDNRGRREAAVPAVETIVQQECEALLDWLAAREVVPVLVELRRKAEMMAREEVEQTLRRLEGVDPRTEQMIARLAHRIVGKLLHEPTVRLKDEAAAGNGVAYAAALRDLFALDGGAVPEDDHATYE